MKKTLIALLLSMSVVSIVGCSPDLSEKISEKEFEKRLNDGENMEGSLVEVKVQKLAPNSAVGYNIHAGKHLNFVSDSHPDVKKGDTVIVEVEDIESMLGSYIIDYDMVKK